VNRLRFVLESGTSFVIARAISLDCNLDSVFALMLSFCLVFHGGFVKIWFTRYVSVPSSEYLSKEANCFVLWDLPGF